jgi:hypothetical protein
VSETKLIQVHYVNLMNPNRTKLLGQCDPRELPGFSSQTNSAEIAWAEEVDKRHSEARPSGWYWEIIHEGDPRFVLAAATAT